MPRAQVLHNFLRHMACTGNECLKLRETFWESGRCIDVLKKDKESSLEERGGLKKRGRALKRRFVW